MHTTTCAYFAAVMVQLIGGKLAKGSIQLQRLLLHIHCSGASRIQASNCSCM